MRNAYLVISNIRVEKVEVLSGDWEFCVVRYPGTDGGFRIRKKRLCYSFDEASRRLPKARQPNSVSEIPAHVKGPWCYPH